MKNDPLISIIVPAYNASKYIENTVKSILNQTYNNIEVMIINDGSTDDTELIIQEIINSDSRIKLISTENLGAGHARNEGLKNSNGQYIRFCDSDDFYPENSTKILLESILRYNADMAMGPLHFLFDDVEIIRGPGPRKGARARGSLPAVSMYARDPDHNLLEWMVYL